MHVLLQDNHLYYKNLNCNLMLLSYRPCNDFTSTVRDFKITPFTMLFIYATRILIFTAHVEPDWNASISASSHGGNSFRSRPFRFRTEAFKVGICFILSNRPEYPARNIKPPLPPPPRINNKFT